jgi:plasmid maintenance system antidote protein VapI
MDIIKRINELIIALNQTSRSFAIACGIKYTTLNNYLVGRRAIGYDTIDAILTGFPEVSAEWLMRGTGPMFKKDIEEAHDTRIDNLIDTIAMQQETIKNLNETIRQLKKQ